MSTEGDSYDPTLEARQKEGRLEKAAYAEVETWLEDSTVGSPKLLVLSDFAALKRVHVALESQPDQERRISIIGNRDRIEEQIREREDTVPGYYGARKEFNGILNREVFPYEKGAVVRYAAMGTETTVSIGISDKLFRLRDAVLSRTDTPPAQSPSK